MDMSSFSLVIIFFQSLKIVHFGDVCDAWEGSRVDRGELGGIHTYPVIFWKWRVFSVFACLPQGKRCFQHPNAVFPKRSPDWRFFFYWERRSPVTQRKVREAMAFHSLLSFSLGRPKIRVYTYFFENGERNLRFIDNYILVRSYDQGEKRLAFLILA